MKQFNNLRKELTKEYDQRIKTQFEKIEDVEGLNWVVRWVLNKRTSYKGSFEEQQNKTREAIKKHYDKKLQEELNYLESIEQAPDFKGRFVITIKWTKNATWGYTCRSETNEGFESPTISGCGYCKKSTATAYALNNNKSILKLMFKVKDDYLQNNPLISNNDLHREILGYGSGYGILPKFEGGVGVNCHETIINRLGLRMSCISEDVYLIEVL